MSSAFNFRPGTLLNLPVEDLALELDRGLPRLYDAHNALNGIAIKAPALDGGFSVQAAVTVITGSKLNIPTGLLKVTQVVASISNGAVATNFTVTARPSPGLAGAVDLFVWQPTSSSVNTPIACTSAVAIHWQASGTSTLT
jgi:hypothetical protein